MRKMVINLLCLTICSAFFVVTAYAEGTSHDELSKRVSLIEAKIEKGIMPAKWAERISVSGLIEVEAGHTSTDPADGDGDDESDIAVSTVELGIEAKIIDHVSGNILFLYEDGEDIAVDEATITISGEDIVPLYLTAGEMYVPFGNFESHMISDPLTLEIAETREAAIQMGFERGGFYGSAFIFNGDADEVDEDDSHIDNFGANAGYSMESDAFNLDFGFSFINNLIDADGWEDVMDEEELALKAYAAGMGAHAIVNVGPVTFIAEYVTAMDDIEWIDEGDNLIVEGEVSAWNLEAGYDFAIGEKEAAVAVALQGTDEAHNRLPETRYLGTFVLGIVDNTTLAFEYFHDEYENDDEEDGFTAQLAIAF
ncbi:hypothetical protein DSCA_39450 [Desulfosarcina alkanivorans]|uniref:Porin domain-containing protein n=1 Tax=Desulfosarcina alkanivorans TaxID=571177 RepID=A0A5K7YNX7_9BACT|nr:LbtU family siderophore porin [Desulfosarcina alkanivorans]BBO70015.1 hypothetical protein DSCA_39450 [Desulfosarcina alkanivorans]